jgi:hypothetical protein
VSQLAPIVATHAAVQFEKTFLSNCREEISEAHFHLLSSRAPRFSPAKDVLGFRRLIMKRRTNSSHEV